MTAEHLSESQLTRYRGRTLGPHELLAVDRHIASCDLCHERLSRLLPLAPSRSEPASRLGDEPFHLDYDEHLAPYVDGTADEIDREIIESHLSYCSACADDLRDLQEFKRQPAHAPAHEHSAATPPPSVLSSWASRRGLSWRWGFQPATALGIAALILCAAAGLWWVTRPAPQRVEQAEHAPPPVVGEQSRPVQTPAPTPSEPTPAPAETPPAQTAERPAPARRGDSPPVHRPKPDALPAVALNDGGGRVTFDGRGHVAGLGPLPRELELAVATALTAGRLDRSPALADLPRAPDSLRGVGAGDETFPLLEPFGVVTESDRPTFRWRALAGASGYTVTVYDSERRPIESSEPLKATAWTVPRPLARGMTYVWQVNAAKGSKTVIAPKPPAPEARFKVLSREAAVALQEARRAHGSSHLAMGVWYWKEGLLAEAEREFEALARANPDSDVAGRLLESVRSLRRR
jgi:anti-sigma factor RsiW